MSLLPDRPASVTISSSSGSDGEWKIESGRKAVRFEASVPVKLQRGGAIARNVSATGIYFVTDEALQKGSTVRFALHFENFPGGPIEVNCVARIVRVEKQGERKGVAAAIQSFEFCRRAARDKSL